MMNEKTLNMYYLMAASGGLKDRNDMKRYSMNQTKKVKKDKPVKKLSLSMNVAQN